MQLYIGVVEDNNDPKQIGRVRIRIPQLHGDGSSKNSTNISTTGLPWFDPCNPFYGGYQAGSFIVPPIGSMVWCAEEKVESGTPYRIYLGGCYGTGTNNEKKFNGTNVPKGELETPSEALLGYPDSAILLKTPTGSVIMVDNTGAIYLRANGAVVQVSGDGVSISAQNIKLEGGSIWVNGVQTSITSIFNVKGESTIEGTTKITGSTIQLNGSGEVDINGGVINLN